MTRWLEMTIMPSKLKKMVRARMEKTGESHQQALRHLRAQDGSSGGAGVPSIVHAVGLPPEATLPPVLQAIFPDLPRAPVNRAYLYAGAVSPPLPPDPQILPGHGTGGRVTISGGMGFTFFLFPTHHDLGWVRETFALPRRRFVVEGSQVQVEAPAGASEADVQVDVNRYCAALRRNGLFVIRAQTPAELAATPPWASAQTIHAAGDDERARISRALREARRELLGPAVDPALVQGYDYFQDAREIYVTCSMRAKVENSVFVALYKVIETICDPLGGADRAGKSLGIAGELQAVKRICNEAARETRHAPAPGQGRRPVTLAELDDVMAKTASTIRAYERHLGL